MITGLRQAAITLAALMLAQGIARAAEPFPSRPLRIVVPSSVGGGADIVARQIGQGLQQAWQQPVVVENKVGAGGAIGTLEVVRAQPDGHTLLLQNSTMVTNHAVASKAPYNPQADLTPILLVGISPLAVFAHPEAGMHTVKDLVAAAAARPGSVAYASCGIGTPHHFAMELMKQKLAMSLSHVGYKGCAPGVTDVLGRHVPVGIATANLIVPHVAAGRLKVLAVSGQKRYALLPNAATLESQGVALPDFSIWYALMGPRDMPAERVARIGAAVAQVLAQPATQEALSRAGIEPITGSAAELSRRIAAEIDQYSRLAKQAGIQPE